MKARTHVPWQGVVYRSGFQGQSDEQVDDLLTCFQEATPDSWPLPSHLVFY